jgi:hypothetical protein
VVPVAEEHVGNIFFFHVFSCVHTELHASLQQVTLHFRHEFQLIQDLAAHQEVKLYRLQHGTAHCRYLLLHVLLFPTLILRTASAIFRQGPELRIVAAVLLQLRGSCSVQLTVLCYGITNCELCLYCTVQRSVIKFPQ